MVPELVEAGPSRRVCSLDGGSPDATERRPPDRLPSVGDEYETSPSGGKAARCAATASIATVGNGIVRALADVFGGARNGVGPLTVTTSCRSTCTTCARSRPDRRLARSIHLAAFPSQRPASRVRGTDPAQHRPMRAQSRCERFDTGLCHLRQLVPMHGLCAITRSRTAVRKMPETPPRTTPTVVGASCSDRRLTQSLDVGGWPRTKAPVAEDETARTWSRPAPRPRPIPNSCRSCHLHGPARRDWRCWDRGSASFTTQSTASAYS